jgi:hypothetical protein
MNREIRFRGKRVDNGEWVYGYLYIFAPFTDDSEHHIQEKEGDNGWSHSIDPATVGQFILTSEGNDIYEGDRLKHLGSGSIRVVSANEVGGVYPFDSNLPRNYDLIGNIHDEEAGDE